MVGHHCGKMVLGKNVVSCVGPCIEYKTVCVTVHRQLEGQLKSARSEPSEPSVHVGISTNIF